MTASATAPPRTQAVIQSGRVTPGSTSARSTVASAQAPMKLAVTTDVTLAAVPPPVPESIRQRASDPVTMPSPRTCAMAMDPAPVTRATSAGTPVRRWRCTTTS